MRQSACTSRYWRRRDHDTPLRTCVAGRRQLLNQVHREIGEELPIWLFLAARTYQARECEQPIPSRVRNRCSERAPSRSRPSVGPAFLWRRARRTETSFAAAFSAGSIREGEGRQRSAPVSIGDYAFLGTNSVLLPGSALPDYSVLGAKSLLERAFVDAYCLYAGVPARRVKDLPRDSAYFTRTRGYVE